MRILLVDDDPRITESLALLLELEGHVVECCADAVEAMRLLEEGRFDLAFVDHALPGGRSGAELCGAATSDGGPRCVLMTGHLAEPVRAVKAEAVLLKPFGRREVVALIERLDAC